MKNNNLTQLINMKVLAQKNGCNFYKWLKQRAWLNNCTLLQFSKTVRAEIIPVNN